MLKSSIEELQECRYVLIVGSTATKRMARVVKQHIEGLGISSKLMTLQVAPLGTKGAQHLLVALIVCYLKGFCQWGLVVYKQRDEDVVLGQTVSNTRVGPYGSLHLTTIDTAIAREINEDGFSLLTACCHTLVVVGIVGLDNRRIQVKVLRTYRWSKGADGFAGCAPESWHHIDGKGQRHQTSHDTDNRHGFANLTTCLVALELQPATQIGAQESEDDYPQREEHLVALCQEPQ